MTNPKLVPYPDPNLCVEGLNVRVETLADPIHATRRGSPAGLPLVSMQVYVATFAVSAYASSYHRAGSKPFNPVLGETYECSRTDKGFRFIAEQVETGTETGTHSGMTRRLVIYLAFTFRPSSHLLKEPISIMYCPIETL